MQGFEYQTRFSSVLRESTRNILVVAPTGAGKTRCGFEALKAAGKGCYVAPTRALCFEKQLELSREFPGSTVVIGNKDYSLSSGVFSRSNYRVLTHFRLNRLLAGAPGFSQASPTVVFDEIHNFDVELEAIITKLMILHPEVRIVALSGTIHPEDVARFQSWLDCEVVESRIRPVPLEMRPVLFHPTVSQTGQTGTEVKLYGGTEFAPYTVPETRLSPDERVIEIHRQLRMFDQAPVLVQTSWRQRARSLIRAFTEEQEMALNYEPIPELANVAKQLPDRSSDTRLLKSALPYGVAFHHGGLAQRERELVHRLSESGKIPLTITCLTLAQGVNLPARHVIFDDIHDSFGGKERLQAVSRFHQIAGRAGRPQFDSCGYCWIPAETQVDLAEIDTVLLREVASLVESSFDDRYALLTQIPSLIFRKQETVTQITNFFLRSFWGSNLDDDILIQERVDAALAELEEYEVFTYQGEHLVLSDLGRLVAQLGIHPAELKAIRTLVNDCDSSCSNWVNRFADLLEELGEELWHDARRQVIDCGLGVYTISGGHSERQLADYVQRMLDTTRSYFRLAKTGKQYCREWEDAVAKKFLFGNLRLMQELAPLLGHGQVKRLVRNLGEVLNREPSMLTEVDHFEIADCLYGNQEKVPGPRKAVAIARALGTDKERWQRLISRAQELRSVEGKDEKN